MPKPATYPTLFNDVLQLNISKLKKWGYLKPNQAITSTSTWRQRGEVVGSITLNVFTNEHDPYIELDYKSNDEPRKYKISLVSIPSNLGKGDVWFFLCPATKKRCRILYLIGGYFLHRTAFKYSMYESQTESKKSRQNGKYLKAYLSLDWYHEELYSKHFRRYYAGKPTKRYLKLLGKIDKAERAKPRTIDEFRGSFL